jgi:hypothetical protein
MTMIIKVISSGIVSPFPFNLPLGTRTVLRLPPQPAIHRTFPDLPMEDTDRTLGEVGASNEDFLSSFWVDGGSKSHISSFS